MIFCYLVEPTVISVSRLSQDCIIEPLSGLLYSHFGVNFTNHDLSGTHQYLPNHWSDIGGGLGLIQYFAFQVPILFSEFNNLSDDFDFRKLLNKSGFEVLAKIK